MVQNQTAPRNRMGLLSHLVSSGQERSAVQLHNRGHNQDERLQGRKVSVRAKSSARRASTKPEHLRFRLARPVVARHIGQVRGPTFAPANEGNLSSAIRSLEASSANARTMIMKGATLTRAARFPLRAPI